MVKGQIFDGVPPDYPFNNISNFVDAIRERVNESVINELTKNNNTMGKFIIIFYEEPTKSGFIKTTPLQYSGTDGERGLITYDSEDEARRVMSEMFPDKRAQIVPILTDNGNETYV